MASKYDQYLSGDTGMGATDRARALTDKYSSILAQPDRDRAQVNMLDEPQPDVAARARRYEAELGVPAPVAAADIKGFDAQARQRKVASAIDANPSLAGIMANPFKAMGLYDDIDEMMKLATAAKTVPARNVRERIGTFFGQGVMGLYAGLSRFSAAQGEALDAITPDFLETDVGDAFKARQGQWANATTRAAEDYAGRAVAGETTWETVKTNPTPGNVAKYMLESTIRSVPGTVTAVAAAPLFIASASGSIGQQRAQNNGRDEADLGDVLIASPFAAGSAAMERLGIERIFGAEGANFALRIAKAGGSEAATEFVQGGIEYAGGTLGTDKGFDPATALDQGVAGAVAGFGMGAGLRTAVEAAEGTRKALNGFRDGQTIETIMGSAEKHASRTRDPETFREFVAAQTDDTPAENVYVPVEAVETLLQSGGLTDDEQAVFGRLSDQIAEARQTGGDIVIPMADAATLLAGTKAWEALKDDARIDAGGLSPREAREQSAQIEATLEQRGQEIIGAADDEIAEAEPAVRVYSEVRQQLVDAGFTPDAANKQAAIFAANREAWGARLGQTAAEYHAANPVEFRRELAGIASTDDAMLDQAAAPALFAAVRHKGKVYKSVADHLSAISQIEDPEERRRAMSDGENRGFVTEKGKFLNRFRAQEYAVANGLLRDDAPAWAATSPDLISENLQRGQSYAQASLPAADGGLTQIGDVSARFSPAAVGNLMASDDWAILTAENPMGEQADELTNRRAMDALKADLAALGVSFAPAVGKYGQVENSFVVVGITRAQAIALGRKYDQDSVLTREGLVYQDGSINPATGSVEAFTDRPDDFFTEVPSTGAKFAVDIDFDQRIAATSEETAIALTQSVDRALRINAPVADVRIAKDGSLLIVADFEPNPAHNAKLAKLMRDSAIEKVRANSAAVLGDTPFRVVLPGDKALAGSTPSALEAPPVDADGKITLQHFSSRDDLTVLDPTHWGTNANFLPPTERAQIGTAPPRTYFGIATNQPGGYVKEFGEGAAEYTARIDASALYDAAGNPDGFTGSSIERDRAVIEAGYLGYWKKDPSLGLVAVVFTPTEVEAVRGPEYRQEASVGGEFPLFQTTGKPRGQIQFTTDGRSVITLFEDADLSTLLHETGHLFFEELKRNALAPNAPADVVADWNAIKKWLKENGQPVVRNQITREGHELMARGFERYLMEGKAPSRDLAGAFATFRSWLVRIYQVVQSLRSPITPEVRAVFDRMLATQQAIDEYAGQQNQVEIDEKSATAMGMTGAEFVAYRESVIGAKREAYDTLLKKTMHAIRVRETKRYKDAAKGVREDVTASVYAEPRFIALRLLRTGRWLNDETRPAQKMTLDREWLIERFGATAIEQLPKGPMLVKTNGDDADMVAEQVGFGSGEAMVRALFEIETEQQALRLAGDKRQVMDKLIDDQVEAIMAQRTEGDALTDGSLEEEAIAAVNGEQQGAVLSTELRYLARRTRASPTPYRMAREWAARKVRAGRVNDVASRAAMQRYSRASAKAAKLAEEAIIAGDYDEAFRQKQAQMLNHALLAEAKAAGDEIDIIVKRMNRLASRATMASVDQDYMDRIHDLLEKYDFRPKSQRWLNEVESFARWAAKQAEGGYEVLVPERLLGDGQHYSRISVDTLFGLRDAVGSLLKLGKLKQSIIDAQEERTFAAFIDEIKANLAQMAGRKQTTEINDKDRWSAAALAPLIKIETLADDMDRGDANGPMNRLLVQRATQAENRRGELRDRVTKRIAQAYLGMDPKARKRLEEKVTIPEWLHKGGALDERNGQPVSMTRMELLSIALNTGNQGNLEKLARGEGWPVAAIQTALRRELSKSDWDFVQDVWDAVDSLWPDIAAAERNLSGVVPEKVMPLEVDTPFGAYRGGYYPVVYDPNRSGTAEKNADNAANDLFGMASGVATPKGHTITRTAAVGPILRSVEGVLFGHIEKVVTRIAYAEYARDVLRVIQHPEVRSAMDLKLGREYRRQIKPWLQRQISGGQVDPRGLGWWEKFSRSARTNMSIVAMGLRWSTGVAQIAGLTSSAARVGVVPLADGIRRTLQNPAAASRFVFDRSPEMAKRNEAMNREVAEFFREVRGKNTLLNRARGMAFWHIGMIDRYVVSVPTWLAAHATAIGQGLTDAQASAVADKAVRQSQGSGREKDMANWQSPPSEPMRWLTLFYTYFNVVLNAQWETGRAANRGDWRKAASLSFWFLVAAPLADALLSGDLPDPDDEDETWEGWAARNMFFNLWSGVPVARDLSAFSERKIMGEYATLGSTPIQRIEEVSVNAYKVVDKLATEGELDDKWLKTAIETPGYFMGLPTGQPAATAQFLWDYSNGDTDPQGFNQWYWGLSKGKVPDEE